MMRHFELFKELAEARKADNSFHLQLVMCSDFAESEKIQHAVELAEDGLITMTSDDLRGKEIDGQFTEKGLQEIAGHHI